jgi:hypothetical protein
MEWKNTMMNLSVRDAESSELDFHWDPLVKEIAGPADQGGDAFASRDLAPYFEYLLEVNPPTRSTSTRRISELFKEKFSL